MVDSKFVMLLLLDENNLAFGCDEITKIMKSTRFQSTTNNKNYSYKSYKLLPASIAQISNDTYKIVSILVAKKSKYLCSKLKLDFTQL